MANKEKNKIGANSQGLFRNSKRISLPLSHISITEDEAAWGQRRAPPPKDLRRFPPSLERRDLNDQLHSLLPPCWSWLSAQDVSLDVARQSEPQTRPLTNPRPAPAAQR